jgi:hypothetical protein
MHTLQLVEAHYQARRAYHCHFAQISTQMKSHPMANDLHLKRWSHQILESDQKS